LTGARQSLRLVPPESFASRLRRQRRIDNLTQAELGERFGVRQQTIGAWERGERPQSRFFARLAQYLGLGGEQELVSLIDSRADVSAEQEAAGDLAGEAADTDAAVMRTLARQFARDQERGSLPKQEAAEIYRDLIKYFRMRSAEQ
jgi:transcriptional regulator with XRE-family HTH domain